MRYKNDSPYIFNFKINNFLPIVVCYYELQKLNIKFKYINKLCYKKFWVWQIFVSLKMSLK
jgi:hypothetical protein